MTVELHDLATTVEVTDQQLQVVLQGDGQDGRAVLSDPAGGRAPLATDGVAGDFWINQATWQVWGPKSGAGWGSPTALGGSAAYVHTQASASATWTVNHNLGFRPAVEVLDAGGQKVHVAVVHTSVNQTVISANTPFTGTARFT